jgi:bacillolysin
VRIPSTTPSVAPVQSVPIEQPSPSASADSSSFDASAIAPPPERTGQFFQAGPLRLESPAARLAIEKALESLAVSGLVAADDNALVPRSVERDTLGFTHVRLDRLFEGIPVLGEQLIAHLDAQGEVADVTGAARPIPVGISGEFRVSPQEAVVVAQAAFEGVVNEAPTVERILAKDATGEYRPAYRIVLSDLSAAEPLNQNYLVDARTGEVFDTWNQIGGFHVDGQHVGRAPGSRAAARVPDEQGAGADDTTIFSGKVEIASTLKEDGTFRLEDLARGKGVETRDAQNKMLQGANPPPLESVEITDNNDVWGEQEDGERTKAAVDAQYGAQMTYDFLKNVLGRDSIDGAGEKLLSKVHVGNNFANAFWFNGAMHYGDGNGRDTGALTSVDIAGHEIMHGLTERSAGLLYRLESGALSEAFSDILGGAGVEWYAAQQNPNVKFDWMIGEDILTPDIEGDALRYMDDPQRDRRGTSKIYSRDHYSDRLQLAPGQQPSGGLFGNDWGYVHFNSGIANNAFYLLVQGGKNRTSGVEVKDPIGMEKGLQIFGRALQFYMTPETNFAEARVATLKAARDLFGEDSPEVGKVQEAWSAVGVE